MCRELEQKALETGISMKETPKVSWFADPEPEELEIHRQISRNLSHAFLRKTLDTILEIYVDYAVRRSFYDKEAGAEKLKRAVSGPPEERSERLKAYFAGLEEAVWKERKGAC